MKPVKLRMIRFFMQSIEENRLPYLLNEEKEVFDKVVKLCRENGLYAKVGEEIEEFARALVESKCKPVWTDIANRMADAGKERDELAKKEEKTEEEDKRLEELTTLLSNMNDEYQKVTDDANKELNEFKDKTLAQYKDTSCFDLHDKE